MKKKNLSHVVDAVILVEVVRKNRSYLIYYKFFSILGRTLVDTSNSASPTTGRLQNGVRSVSKKINEFSKQKFLFQSSMSMYDRVKNRRKSMDPDVYSEEREENDDNEQPEGGNDQNNENDDETKRSKTKKTESPHRNGGEDTNEENTMDVLHQDEDEEEEEELNNQQRVKYSLRERKPPIQRLTLYGNSLFYYSFEIKSVVFRTTTTTTKNNIYDEDDERPSTSRSRRSRQRGYV